MRRRLRTLLMALSLLLFVAAVALWMRSYWFVDTIRWSGARVYTVASHNGLLVWNDFRPDPGDPPGPWWKSYRGRDRGYSWERLGGSLWNRAGFGFAAGYTAGNDRIRQVTVPHWFLTLAAALPAGLALHSILRWRRRAMIGLCSRCGYDLRATPGRCPECGTEPPLVPSR